MKDGIPDDALVVIWSGEHRMYWRPDGTGYTTDLNRAGVFIYANAVARTKHCGPEKAIEIRFASTKAQSASRVPDDLLAVAETFLAYFECGCVEQHKDDPFSSDDVRAAIAKAREALTSSGGVAESPTLVEALRACEKNLRVIHEAAGPCDFDKSAPSSFAAWKLAHDALASFDASSGVTNG